jgi:hypothetical protein
MENNKKGLEMRKSAKNISLAGPFQLFHSPFSSTMDIILLQGC